MIEILWILLFTALVIGLPYTYFKKGIKFCIGIAYIAGVIIYTTLFYRYYGIKSVLSGLVFSAQLFTFGVNAKDIVEMLDGIHTTVPFVVCVWTTYLICPVLMISVLLTYIKKGLDRTALKTTFFRNIYIFTEKTENMLVLARDICASDRRAIVIFSSTDGDNQGARILCVSYSVETVFSMLNRTNNISICFNDKDTGVILDKINRYLNLKKKKQANLYAFTDNPVAYEVIDGIKKSHQCIIKIISTHAILMRQILWDYPLYLNRHKADELNVSVFGTGNFGGYFAMNTLWCAVMPDCRLKLNLVDSDSSENVLSRVSDNASYDYFDIEIFNENINTNSFFDKIFLTRLKDSDYILVAMGNDDLNISISRKIRLYFARRGKNPFILTVLKNQSKFSVMSENLKKENIVVTGGAQNIYSYENIFRDRFFKKAFEVFKIVENNYGKVVTEDDFFMQKQIDILSSYANAVHCKYKIYSLMGSEEASAGEINEKLALNKEKLVQAEHERWVAFEVLKGYVGVEPEKLEEFLESNKATGKIHKNEALKIHACITDLAGMEKLDSLMKEKYSINHNLKEIDELIAEKTAALWFNDSH